MARHASSVGAITGRARGTRATVFATERTYHRGRGDGRNQSAGPRRPARTGTRHPDKIASPGQDRVTRTRNCVTRTWNRVTRTDRRSPGQGCASPGQPTELPGHPEAPGRVRAACDRVRVAVARFCGAAGQRRRGKRLNAKAQRLPQLARRSSSSRTAWGELDGSRIRSSHRRPLFAPLDRALHEGRGHAHTDRHHSEMQRCCPCSSRWCTVPIHENNGKVAGVPRGALCDRGNGRERVRLLPLCVAWPRCRAAHGG